MRVKIYQINSARDNANRKFMSLKDGEAVDSSIYAEEREILRRCHPPKDGHHRSNLQKEKSK